MKVSGRTKSSGQDCERCAPMKIPNAVLTYQVVQRVRPAPRKYKCLLSGESSRL
jgi:hypothetical protein